MNKIFSIKKLSILLFVVMMTTNLFACKKETKIAQSPIPRNKTNIQASTTENKTVDDTTNDNILEKRKTNNNFKLTEIAYCDEASKASRQSQIYSVMNSKKWTYGRTPVEWVFVEANKQLVSNYKPNGSKKYAVTENASSGERGCFVPILSGTENYGDNYEGRFFCFDDTTKDPTNLPFTNKIADMLYDGRPVGEILGKVMDITYTQYGIIETDKGLLNVIYATDLDEIIKNNY